MFYLEPSIPTQNSILHLSTLHQILTHGRFVFHSQHTAPYHAEEIRNFWCNSQSTSYRYYDYFCIFKYIKWNLVFSWSAGNEIIQFPSGSVSLPAIRFRPYSLANCIAEVFRQVELEHSLDSFAPVFDLNVDELILLYSEKNSLYFHNVGHIQVTQTTHPGFALTYLTKNLHGLWRCWIFGLYLCFILNHIHRVN